jgi:hypothetical protein
MRRYIPARLRRRFYGVGRRVLRRVAGSVGEIGRYRYVFVVTYGRSGSTLLMSLLNTIPGYRINGENYNALYRLYQADKAITQSYEKAHGNGHLVTQSAWYGTPRVRPTRFRLQLLEAFVAHVLRPAPGDRVLGFKEIRYTTTDIKDLEDFLEFLAESFPGCKIVFNHRTVADVAQSSWWANSERSLARLQASDERLWSIPADDRHYHFVYDEIDDSLDSIRKLFAFLGEEVQEEAVRRVLASRHGPPKEYAVKG